MTDYKRKSCIEKGEAEVLEKDGYKIKDFSPNAPYDLG